MINAPSLGLPKAIICDLDGCLAHRVDRGPYDWDKVGGDTLDEHVMDVIQTYRSNGYKILIMTGRDDVAMEETIKWLERHNVPYNELHMRRSGDNRKHSIVKKELFELNIKDRFKIHFVLDDRDQVVNMWRNELGLKCFQVQAGDF